VALPPAHRKPSSDASARPVVARLRPLAISLDDQPHRRWHNPRLHALWITSYAFIRSLRSLTTSPPVSTPVPTRTSSEFLHTLCLELEASGRFQPGPRVCEDMDHWTIDIVDVANHDSWKLIESKTLAVRRVHGMRLLDTLSRHTINVIIKTAHHNFLRARHWDPRHRVEGARLPVWVTEMGGCINLLGVTLRRRGGWMRLKWDVCRPRTPAQFIDCACDCL